MSQPEADDLLFCLLPGHATLSPLISFQPPPHPDRFHCFFVFGIFNFPSFHTGLAGMQAYVMHFFSTAAVAHHHTLSGPKHKFTVFGLWARILPSISPSHSEGVSGVALPSGSSREPSASPSSAPRPPSVLGLWPFLCVQSQQQRAVSLSYTSPRLPPLTPPSSFKDTCDYMGLTWITQENLSISCP